MQGLESIETSAYNYNFEDHYINLRNELNIEEELDLLNVDVIMDLKIVVDERNQFETFEYRYFYYTGKYYRAYIKNGHNSLKIKKQKIHRWNHYYMMVGADDVFTTLNEIGIESLESLLNGEYLKVSITLAGLYNYDDMYADKNLYIYENNEIAEYDMGRSLYRTAFIIAGLNEKDEVVTDEVYVLFDGYVRDYKRGY